MKKQAAAILIGTCMAASALAGYKFMSNDQPALEASGTIETRNIGVGSKTGGRIERVLVTEGESVSAGQVLLTLDPAESDAATAQAAARVARAKAQYDKYTNGYRSEEIAEARAIADQANAALAEAKSGYRPEEIAQAAAERDRAQSEADNAKTTYTRYEDLLRDNVISRQQRDDAQAKAQQTQAALEQAKHRLSQLKSGYRQETVDAAVSRLGQTRAAAQRLERGFRPEEIAAARAELAQANAELGEMKTRQREMQVVSPTTAIVEVLDHRPGDLATPNGVLATLVERDQLYVRVYVPEAKLGMVKVGQTAELGVDAFPGRWFPARVEQINQKAEYLPRNVQTSDARSHQVFGVKLRIEDPTGSLRAGMAANVKLREGGK